MRAFTAMWDRICRERYGVTDPKLRRFRYGVQVNSLGLTEQQPENNVPRIVLEALGVTLSHDARARAIQLPAWNEALGPAPALGPAVVAADPADPRLRDRPARVRRHLRGLHRHRGQDRRADRGRPGRARRGAGPGRGLRGHRRAEAPPGRAARPTGSRRIESGEQPVVGVNCFTETRPVAARTAEAAPTHPEGRPGRRGRAAGRRGGVARGRDDQAAVARALDELRRAADDESRRQHHAGHHRPGPRRRDHRRVGRGAARGLRRVPGADRRGRRRRPPRRRAGRRARRAPRPWPRRTGGPPRLLVAKPGLDGHSNGAEQIAVAARDAGFEVIYQGIRLTPEQIVAAARDEDVDVVGLSILSGSHLELVPEVLDRLRAAGVDAPVVVGGIIPADDAEVLRGQGGGRRLHAQGLRARPHHGRAGHPGRAAPGGLTMDTVIRGGTVLDGTGAPGRRADVAIDRRPHRGRRRGAAGRPRARRLRPGGLPRLHRHPHPLRRAGLLGPPAHPLLVPRGDLGHRREHRVLHRPDPPRRGASCWPAPSSTSRT